MDGFHAKPRGVHRPSMRPAPITRQHCIDQALAARDAAMLAQNERERLRLVRVAAAYEALALKVRV